MKTTVFTSVFVILVFGINAQVTIDKKYDFSASIVKLETWGYKYFIMDVPNSQCRIYNTDHSLFRTVNCNIPTDFYLSDVKFLSEKLFDSDAGIELLCTFYKYNSSLNYYEYDSKIINEDGSQIQFIDGGLYNYINKTSDNTYKLFSYCFDYSVFPERVWTSIYDLPKNPVYGEEEIFICGGSDYLGWNETGDYNRTIVLENGGDSIVTTHLIVLQTFKTFEQISICEGENYLDWTEPGDYKRILVSANECDSVVTTHLSFYTLPQPEIIIWGDTLKSNKSFVKYQWLNKEGEIPGANQTEYIIQESGEYFLKITDSNGCNTISAPVNAIFSSGNRIGLNDFKYSIIPNPNNGKFSFRVDSNPLNEMQLKLLNSLGQAIEIKLLINVQTNYEEQFNVSNLGKGIYYLQIDLNKTIKTEKIIIK